MKLIPLLESLGVLFEQPTTAHSAILQLMLCSWNLRDLADVRNDVMLCLQAFNMASKMADVEIVLSRSFLQLQSVYKVSSHLKKIAIWLRRIMCLVRKTFFFFKNLGYRLPFSFKFVSISIFCWSFSIAMKIKIMYNFYVFLTINFYIKNLKHSKAAVSMLVSPGLCVQFIKPILIHTRYVAARVVALVSLWFHSSPNWSSCHYDYFSLSQYFWR